MPTDWLRQIGLTLTGGDAVTVPKAHLAALDKVDTDCIRLHIEETA